jgi:hypothetical protein
LAYASDDNTALELGIEMYESGDFWNFEDASVTTDVCGIEKEIEYFFLTLFDQNRN